MGDLDDWIMKSYVRTTVFIWIIYGGCGVFFGAMAKVGWDLIK